MTTALVLGATGFIGGHIARSALARGWQVRGLRRRPGAVGHLAQAPIQWVEGDVDVPDTLEPAFRGADIVFHAAAFYPRSSRRVASQVSYATRQVRNVLQATRRAAVHRLVFTSTLTTIGPPPPGESRLADERDHYLPGSLPRSAYYECKYAMESEVLRARDIPAIVLNPTAVLGPGDIHFSVGRVVVPLTRGWGLAWIPAQVNVVDVRDVAEAHLRAADIGRLGERTILGAHNLAVRDLMSLAATMAGVQPPRFEIPLAWVEAAVWLSDRLPFADILSNHLRAIRHWQGYDCSKAARELGLVGRPLEETLRDALDWYAGHPLRKTKPTMV